MSMTPKHPTLPATSTVMVWEEFIQVTGVDPERLQELLALGWIEARNGFLRQGAGIVLAGDAGVTAQPQPARKAGQRQDGEQ